MFKYCDTKGNINSNASVEYTLVGKFFYIYYTISPEVSVQKVVSIEYIRGFSTLLLNDLNNTRQQLNTLTQNPFAMFRSPLICRKPYREVKVNNRCLFTKFSLLKKIGNFKYVSILCGPLSSTGDENIFENFQIFLSVLQSAAFLLLLGGECYLIQIDSADINLTNIVIFFILEFPEPK